MTTQSLTLSPPRLVTLMMALGRLAGRRAAANPAPSQDAEFRRRAFISERMAEFPDAITSENGMAVLMSQFPRDF